MAYDYKSVNAALSTTQDTAIYTTPVGKTAIVLLCQVSNVDGTNAADLNMDYYDSSETSAKALASTINIPADSSFNPIGGKLVLEASDELRAWTLVAADDLEIVISVVEIS